MLSMHGKKKVQNMVQTWENGSHFKLVVLPHQMSLSHWCWPVFVSVHKLGSHRRLSCSWFSLCHGDCVTNTSSQFSFWALPLLSWLDSAGLEAFEKHQQVLVSWRESGFVSFIAQATWALTLPFCSPGFAPQKFLKILYEVHTECFICLGMSFCWIYFV